MTTQTDIEELTKNIINLPKNERLEIARFILFLDNNSSETDVDSVWEDEIIKRAKAVEDGTAKSLEFFEAMKSIERRFMS